MEKTYEEQPIVYYEYEKLPAEEVLNVETKNATATEGEKVNVPNVVVPSLEGSKITCAEVNGLKIDANGSLVGTPKDILFESGKKEATVKLEVVVENNGQKVTKGVSVTVNKKAEPEVPVEKLTVETKNATATEGEKVNIPNVVVPSLEGSKITCAEVNGLKIDANGSLVGTPKDVVFESGKKEATVKLNVTVKNGDETVSKEVPVTVTKKVETSRPSRSSRKKKKYEAPAVVTENEYKVDDIVVSSDINSARPLVRLAGKDRTETSVEVSKSIYPKGADVVVISNKEKSSDSISATPYANLLKAPILYSNASAAPDSIVNEIKRLRTKKIVIVGGDQSITKSQEEQLKAMGIEIDRINGKDRYETSSMIADRMIKLSGTADNVVIANGNSQVDAVSIAPIAIKQTSPILLTNGNKLSAETDKIVSNSKNVILAGGSQSISANLEKYIRSKSSKNVDRISGKDRYETAAAIAKKFSGNPDVCIYANGTKVEDALVSAQLSGYKNAPIILVNNKNMSESAKNYVKNNKIKKNIFVGGGNSISDETIKTVDGLVKDNK
nr:cell wall-binding repeat-containing protein [Peptostreptococcus russellii]